MSRKMVSVVMQSLMLIGMLTLAFGIQSAKGTGTIFIRPDGSIDSTDKIRRDGARYSFTDNIYDSIVVERDNIVLDGNGYTLQGTASGFGIQLLGVRNVTVRDTRITNFAIGIGLGGWYAGELFGSSNNSIIGNDITVNGYCGIRLFCSSNDSIIGNDITANDQGISSPTEYGFANDRIIGNNITANRYQGITASMCGDNIIIGNNISANGQNGICGGMFDDNIIIGNNISANGQNGIDFGGSWGNNISGNIINANAHHGIYLAGGGSESIRENTIADNECGIYLGRSSDNTIHHNNFNRNAQQVYCNASANVWDNGYPSGGNYWSDCAGVDVKSGPSQNQFGSDGIGDTSYIIDAQNVDHYPLMNPWVRFVTSTVDLKPNSLSLKSKLTWFTAYMELPAPYSLGGIDVSTIKLNGAVLAGRPTQIGDYDRDGILDLMVKFNATNVKPLLDVGINRLTVTAKVNGRVFEGTDVIKVLA